jgi:hypothetical protein
MLIKKDWEKDKSLLAFMKTRQYKNCLKKIVKKMETQSNSNQR